MPFKPSTAFEIAVSCGTPTPVTIRVVQIDPGPIPTLTASTPASAIAFAPDAVATLPAIICKSGYLLRASLTLSNTPCE